MSTMVNGVPTPCVQPTHGDELTFQRERRRPYTSGIRSPGLPSYIEGDSVYAHRPSFT